MPKKNHGLEGISSTVELGSGGSKIKENSGVIEHRNSADDDYVIARADTPVDSNDLTTKNWVEANTLVNPMTTDGDIIIRSGGVSSRLAIGSAAEVLTVSGGLPSWQAASGGFTDPMTTRGDLIYRNASNVTARLPIGLDTYVIQSDGTDVSWASLTASDVSDFDTEVSNNTDVAANTVHRTSDGTDHTYIDQDVTTTASPTFVSLTSLDYIDFDTVVAAPAHQTGRLHWSDDDGTLEIGLDGDETLPIGQKGIIKVRNVTGGTLDRGTVVYMSGSSGNRPTVDAADNTDGDMLHVLGMLAEDIADSSNGFCYPWGVVKGTATEPIDTSTMIVGDKLYLDTAGGWTTTHPTNATHATVVVGTVQRVHATEGWIYVEPSQSFAIGNEFDGTIRQSVINKSSGTSAASGFTAVNDAGHWMTVGIGGTNSTAFADNAIFYGPGYNDNLYAVDGNKSHKWYVDPTDSHNNSSLSYLSMELQADGDLIVSRGQIVSTIAIGTAPLNVTSTTLNANFNADLLDGQEGSYYLARANHTGTQTASTISDFQTTVSSNSDVTANTAKVTNATHSGDVTGSGVLTISAGAVDIAMLSATGTPSSATFLRGDNTWATPAGSGDVSKVGTPVNDQVGVWTGDGTIEGTSGLTYSGTVLDISGNITLTGTVDGIDIATDVAANTAKVTNATHTDEVTGSGALALAAPAISNRGIVTAVGSDYVLIGDTSDSGNLKRALISDFASAGGDMAASTYDPANIAEQLVGLTAIQTLTNKTLTAPAISNPTGLDAADISDFDTEVSNNTDVSANTSARHDAVTLAASATTGGLSLSTQEIGFQAASGSLNGYLTSTDWTTFNNKSDYADALTTRGDILYRNASITTRLPVGTPTQVLQSDGTDVSWQTITASDVSDFDTEVSNNSSVVANTAKITNANHSGDATGDTVLTITADAVTYAKMQNVVSDDVLLGNIAGAGGIVAEITPTQIRTLINVEDGATANSSDATLLNRANHTGTQTASTIVDFDGTVSANTDVAANSAVRHDPLTLDASATTGGLSLTVQDLEFQPATTGQNGYLTSTDWTTFNNKITDPLTTRGDLLYRNASVTTRLPIGLDTYVIQSDGTDVSWAALTASDVSDFESAVSANTDVAANTAARHVAATVADTSSIDMTLTGQQISGAVLPAGVDHDSLLNYAANEHFTMASIVIDANQVELPEIGTATYDDVQDWSDTTQSAGVFSGGVISDGGSGTVDVSDVKGIVKTTDSDIGANRFFDLTGLTGQTLTDNDTNYISVDYNSGTPQFVVGTSNTANGHTIFNLGKVYREGTSVDIITSGLHIEDFSKRVQQHHLEESSLHFTSGAIVSETGTLNIAISSGVMYAGLNRITTNAIDTSVADDFEYYYYTGSAWTESDQTAIDELQYNDIATGLVTLSNNKYGVHWVYKGTNSSTYVVYGQGDYSLTEAQQSQPPASLPDHVSGFGVLRAKIIIAKSDTSFTEIESVEDTAFTSSTPTAHNDLTSIQGGAADDYYHLTLAQHTDLTDAGDSTSHYHATDRARANHTGTQAASTISDFDTEVSNNTDVAANTSARHAILTLAASATTAGLSLSTQELSYQAATGAQNGYLTSTDWTTFNGKSSYSDPLTTRGDIVIRNASITTRLAVGTTGQVLTTDGTDVSWGTPSGSGDVTAAASMTDNTIVRGDGGAKGVQDTGIAIDDTDHVTAVETLGYASAYAIGNSSTAFNLTLSNGQHQTLTLTGDCAMTIVDTGNIGDGQWTITCTQGGVGSFAITSATVSGGTVKVEGGTDPTFSTAVGAVDTVVVKKEGTVYYVQVSASDWQTWT